MREDYSNLRYAVINKPLELDTRKVWRGTYQGIRYEVNYFNYPGSDSLKDNWTHYIIVNLDQQLTKEHADSLWLAPDYEMFGRIRDLPNYNYYDSAVSKIEFHGGCTYYKKESQVDDHTRIVKIGCDYQHLWDEGQIYDVDYVQREAKKSIDSFLEHFGPIKVGSWGDGKYRYIEEFTGEKSE